MEAQEWDSRGEDKASDFRLGREGNSRTRREKGTRKISQKAANGKAAVAKPVASRGLRAGQQGGFGFTGKQDSKIGTKTEQRSVQWTTEDRRCMMAAEISRPGACSSGWLRPSPPWESPACRLDARTTTHHALLLRKWTGRRTHSAQDLWRKSLDCSSSTRTISEWQMWPRTQMACLVTTHIPSAAFARIVTSTLGHNSPILARSRASGCSGERQ